MLKVLQPTNQKFNFKTIYGFDIETYNNNKKFYCGSIYKNDSEKWVFYEKDEFIDFFKKERFKNSIISATNLAFDFFGLFFDSDEIKHFETLFRGSQLISAKTYLTNKKFSRLNKYSAKKLLFLDTLNYSNHSVEDIGKILNIPKLKKPDFLGKKPKNSKEIKILTDYNLRDSELSKKYLEFLFNSFRVLGCNSENTIAKTSLSLFKNKFLKYKIYQHSQNIILEQFKCYYGGRTEAFCRGNFKNYYYYDVNSLYPYVMTFKYPNPNTLRFSKNNTQDFINNYEGFSEVLITSNNTNIPLLPYISDDNKLIFPNGDFRGCYTHIELRKALSLGYEIKKVFKSYYFKESDYIFREFVEYLYKLRLEYQKDKNPMEHTIKLLLNSLYGKFAQRFLNMDNWIPIPETYKELSEIPHFYERIGKFIRTKEDRQPPSYSFPILSAYVTAYARILMYNMIYKYKPIYTDTDSIFVKSVIESSKKLGSLKCEDRIKYGIIVKPKFYGYINKEGVEKVRAKGLGVKLNYNQFLELLNIKSCSYTKFLKFKEALRRQMKPNEIINISKYFNLNDNKRKWEYKNFNPEIFEESKPLLIIN